MRWNHYKSWQLSLIQMARSFFITNCDMCFCCSHLSSPSPRSSFGSDRTFIGRQWCARKCKEIFGSVYRPLNEKILSRTFRSNVCWAVQRCFSGRKIINYAGISQPWGLGRLTPSSPPPTDFFIKKWRLTVSEVFSALQLQVTRQPLTRKNVPRPWRRFTSETVHTYFV